MNIDISKLDEAELVELNRRIVARLRYLQEARTHHQMLSFNVGDRVRFHPPGHDPKTGVIVKYNRKTVTILTADGQPWRVSPSLLRHEAPMKRTEPAGRRLVGLDGPED